MTDLRITEIFRSLQGEADTVGWPTVFVRLTGCPLRCFYCDSEYAFHGGEKQSLEAVLARVKDFDTSKICVTGGEPLAQPECLSLLARLCDASYEVSLETSGALPVERVDSRVSIVMDLKGPSSGEVDKNRYENLAHLKGKDQVKFIIADRADYEWARFKVDEYGIVNKVKNVLFSPSFDVLSATDLAEWILDDGLAVRLQVQLHKYLWGDKPGV